MKFYQLKDGRVRVLNVSPNISLKMKQELKKHVFWSFYDGLWQNGTVEMLT